MSSFIPEACRAINNELEAASKVLEGIQSNPNYIDKDGPHPGRPNPGMLREAEAEEKKIAELSGQLNECLRAHGFDPTEICTFAGTATLESSLGAGSHAFSIPLEFNAPHHRTFFVEKFQPLKVEAGGHTLTITKTGGGSGTLDSNGKMTLQVDLKVDAAWPGGHMNLAITLSSANHHGSPMNSHGKVTMIGTSTGHGSGIGFPESIEVTMITEGTVSPRP